MRPPSFSKLHNISLCLAFLYVFAGSPAHAQLMRRPLAISGAVHDTDEKPVQGVEVQLFSDSGDLAGTAFTRSTGEFEFGDLRSGGYLVLIDTKGYETLRENVSLPGLSRTDVNLILRKTPGTTSPVPVSEEVVTARELALPESAQAALRKGREHLYEKNDPAGSLSYFAKVLKISPDFYEAHYYAGMAHLFQNQITDAETAFRAALDGSHDEYSAAFISLATVLSSTNRFAEAETSARRGLRLQPDSWQGYLELARAQLGLNMPVEAEKSAIEASQRKPDFADVYITLLNIHLRLRNAPALLQDADNYLKLAPNGRYSVQVKRIRQQVAASTHSGEF
ncbi:MAG TPA: carboxypeptidase regulatory-like domain-containing protein [Candidatus Acidoferrales bacterium]|nr:carboxypeptidase regulatory-like domain-containing protein [Candidatus Acidoferrales bacterium]